MVISRYGSPFVYKQLNEFRSYMHLEMHLADRMHPELIWQVTLEYKPCSTRLHVNELIAKLESRLDN